MPYPRRRLSALPALALLLLSVAAMTAEPIRYEHSAQFDSSDRLGAVNYLNAAAVVDASQLVKQGKSYALGVISSADVPVWGERQFGLEVVGVPLSPTSPIVSAHDDRWLTHVGIGTQIDGLGHVGVDGLFYNGQKSKDFYTPQGLRDFGTEHIPPIVGRGVLLDVAGHLGKARLDASQAIDTQLLQAVAKAQGVTLRRGDVVLLHTGWMAMMDEDGEAFIQVQPGLDVGAARYLAEQGVVAIGSDTGALEVQPSTVPNHPYPVHGLLLANYGVYILENIVTRELAADGAHEFLFVLGQPRLAGSVQAIINPVAIR